MLVAARRRTTKTDQPMTPRICICGTQVPFQHGGAEVLVESLRDELRERGHLVELVTVPFSWSSRLQILESAMAWRLLDLEASAGEKIDLVICTRFPTWAVRHPNKVVWLVHQFRQVYELLGTRYSDFSDSAEDQQTVDMIHRMDRLALGEARRVFTISGNTAARLQTSLGIEGRPLYPPPALGDRYRSEGSGDYVLSVGRLDAMKRVDSLLRGLAAARTEVRCIVAGEGPQAGELADLAASLGVSDRVDFVGRVNDERLLDLYAGALAVYFAPFDEDYGYVTVEAFKSSKPVITAADSGGVLELVEDGVNGIVVASPSARRIARAMDSLFRDRELADRLGRSGHERVREIGWDGVIEALLSSL